MRILSNKLNGRAIISVLLATIVLLCPYFTMEISSKVAALQEGLIIFEDNFDRADGEIGNGWIKGSKADAKIVNNAVNLQRTPLNRGSENKNAYVTESAVMRPQTEATLNQSVSADFLLNEGNNKKPDVGGAVIARCQDEKASNSNCYSAYIRMCYDGVNNNAYDLVVKNTSGVIYSSYKTERTSGLYSNVKHRLTLKAESISSTSTKLTVSLFTIAANGTATLVKEVVLTDTDSNLQSAGTVGFSMYDYYGLYMTVDNFKYQTVETEEIPEEPTLNDISFSDNFDRADGELGNDWIKGDKADAKIVNNAVNLQRTPLNRGSENRNAYVTEMAVMRPQSEATLNQIVSADFSLNEGGNKKVDVGGAVIARCQDEKASNSNCYSAYIRMCYDGVNNNAYDLVVKNTSGVIYSSYKTERTSGLYSNVKHRLTLKAESISSTSTKLTVSLYTIAGDGIATLVKEVVLTDTDSNLQSAGTVGFSMYEYYGFYMTVDNFKYQTIENEEIPEEPTLNDISFSDNFDRADGELGNDWIKGDKADVKIVNNAVNLQRTPLNRGSENRNAYVTEMAVMRPQSEATLNQIVSADFSLNEGGNKKVDVGGAVIARCQDEKASNSNCYSAYIRMGYDGANNNAYDLVVKNTSGVIYSSYKTERTAGLYSNVKHRLTLKAESISNTETKLTVSLYTIAADGTATLVKEVVLTDTDSNLQSAGTVGFSMYEYYGFYMTVDNFKYQTIENEEIPEKPILNEVSFSDNFDDKSGAINGINDWIDQQFLLKGEKIASVKNGKLVIDNGKKTDTGAYTNKIMRPMSEATLNQYVSLDIENLKDITGVEVDLRLIEIPSNTDATNNRHAMYGCSVSKTSLAIVTRLGWSQGEIGIARWEYKEGHKYRLEATALGSLPTTLTATLYDLTENGEIVATVTAKDESINTANHRTTQIPGTVGISYTGEVPVEIDNFIYKQTDEVVCHDRFNRNSGKPDNDWVIGSGSQKTAISSAKLVMNNDGVDDMWGTALIRPSSENSIDQYVGIEFQRPDGMENLSSPIVFARSQTGSSVTINGKQGFSTYYAQVTFTGEWSSKISIYKVGNDGVKTLLKEGIVNDYGGGSTGKANLQLIAEGTSPTKLTVILYVAGDTRHYKVYNATVYDNQPELQKAGTTGVSYSGSTKSFTVNRFSYFIPQAQPDEPSVPEDLTEDYMAYFSGTVASGEFGQWIELEPNKTYVYTVKIKKILNSGGFATRVQYNPQNLGRVYRDAKLLSHTYDEETFVETIEFTVPKEAHIQHNGKARIKIVVHEGGLGSVGYATDFKVYEKDDAEQKNLLVNPNFKKGLYAWCGHGEVQGVTEANVLVTKTRGEVQLVKFDPLAFVRDDSDIYFNDGNWAENFETVNYDGDSGKVSGRLVDILRNPISSATVSLSDTLIVKTDKNGEFVFTDVPADIYFLSVTLSDGKMAEFDEIIDVKEGSEINIQLTFEEETEDFEFDYEEITESESDDESSNDNQKEDSNNKSEDKKTNANKKTENNEVVLLPWIIAGVVVVFIIAIIVVVIILIRKKRKQVNL